MCVCVCLCCAEGPRRKREEQLETNNKILLQKLEKARASAPKVRYHDDDAALHHQAHARTPRNAVHSLDDSVAETPASYSSHTSPPQVRDSRGRAAAWAPQGETPTTVSRGGCGGALSSTGGQMVTAARAMNRVRGTSSLIGAPRGSVGSLMSNDADGGGKFIRSGPDGMGGKIRNFNLLSRTPRHVARFHPLTYHIPPPPGTVHVCVQDHSAAQMRTGFSERPSNPAGSRNIVCNPAGIITAGAKRPNSAPAKTSTKAEASKKPRSTGDISSFFGPPKAGAHDVSQAPKLP